MLSVKSILLEQFTACYDENGWFVTLKNALQKRGNLRDANFIRVLLQLNP